MNEPFNIRDILAQVFQKLVQDVISDLEARALLNKKLADFNVRPIPPLPPLFNKIVEANAPFHFSQAAAVEAKAAPASSQDRAIYWLAAKLRQDRTARFADYQAECIETFKISKLAYKTQVWPAARKMAGLGKAKAGRPPAKK